MERHRVEDVLYGMSAFTQRALIEIEKIERQNMKEKIRRKLQQSDSALSQSNSSVISPLPTAKRHRQLKSLTSGSSSAVFLSPPLEHAKRCAQLALKCTTPPPVLTDASLAPLDLVALAWSERTPDKTFHHLYHLRSKQERIRRLEQERLTAAEEASHEAQKQEQAKERRAQRQYQSRMSSFQQAEVDILAERASYIRQHDEIVASGLQHNIPAVLSGEFNAMLWSLPGERVAVVSHDRLEQCFSSISQGVPEELASQRGARGVVLLGACDVDHATVAFEGQRDQEVWKRCLRPRSLPPAPTSPLVITASGICLEVKSVHVIAEVIGDVCIFTQKMELRFPRYLTEECADEHYQQLGVIIPIREGAFLRNMQVDAGDSRLRIAPLCVDDGKGLLDASCALRAARMMKRHHNTPDENRSSERNTPTTPRTKVRTPQRRPLSPQVSPLVVPVSPFSRSTTSSNGTRDGVWQDAFDYLNSPYTIPGTIFVPLKEVCVYDRVSIELTVYQQGMTIRNNDGSARSRFTLPCKIPEPALPMPPQDPHQLLQLDVVVGGAAWGDMLVDSSPSVCYDRCETSANGRPIYSVARKDAASEWCNNDIEVSASMELAEEISAHVMVEVNPSALRADTFVVVLAPSAASMRETADSTFRRISCLIVEVDDPEIDGYGADVIQAAKAYLTLLGPSDLVSTSVVKSGRIHYNSDTRFGDKGAALAHFQQLHQSGSESPVPGSIVDAVARSVGLHEGAFSKEANADTLFEVALMFVSPLSFGEQCRLAALVADAPSYLRFHICYSGKAMSTTRLTLQGCCSSTHGVYTHAETASSRLEWMLSFSLQLANPTVVDVEFAFPRTNGLEVVHGAGPLSAGGNLVVVGRYSYNNLSESAETVSITARMTKGRQLRRRMLCPKTTMPLTTIFQPYFLNHELSRRWVRHLAHSTSLTELPAFDDLISDAAQYRLPLRVPCDLEGTKPWGGVGLFCVQTGFSLDMPHTAFPPAITRSAPGFVPAGGCKTWADSLRKQLDKDLMECGCFVPVPHDPHFQWSAMEAPGNATACNANSLVDWLGHQLHSYASRIDGVTEDESQKRHDVLLEQWRTFVELVHDFHERRLALVYTAVAFARDMTDLEEQLRTTRISVLKEENAAWAQLLQDTEAEHTIIRRVNLFSFESRRRLAFEEETHRRAIAHEYELLGQLEQQVVSHNRSPNAKDVQDAFEIVAAFADDEDTSVVTAALIALWTANKKNCEALGVFGAVPSLRSLLQRHIHNSAIVESLLIATTHLARIRANLSKLETSNIVLDGMHALRLHRDNPAVQTAGLNCLSVLAQSSPPFRQFVIASANGLQFVIRNLYRHVPSERCCEYSFRFFLAVAEDPESHAALVETGVNVMCTVILAVHRKSEKLYRIFVKVLALISSSRVLRLSLACQGTATAALVTLLNNRQWPVKLRQEALYAVDRMCGNVGDFPAAALCSALYRTMVSLLQGCDGAQGDEAMALARSAAQLQNRLTLSLGTMSVQCDDILKPFFKPWDCLHITGIVEEETISDVYGSLFSGDLIVGGARHRIIARVFARTELAHYLPSCADSLVEDSISEPSSTSRKKSLNEEGSAAVQALHSALLALHLHDVITNVFVRHHNQIECLGFASDGDIHATLYRVTGTPLKCWLHDRANARLPVTLLDWLSIGLVLAEVAEYFKACTSVHGQLLLWNIFLNEQQLVDSGMRHPVPWELAIQVGPAAALTPEILDCIPANQTYLSKDVLEASAKKTSVDDVTDILSTLLSVLTYGVESGLQREEVLERQLPSHVAAKLYTECIADAGTLHEVIVGLQKELQSQIGEAHVIPLILL